MTDEKTGEGTVAELTLEVLRGLRTDMRTGFEAVRAEIGKTNERLDRTNDRLDQTNVRLDETISRLDRLERRQTESEVRIATEIVGVAGAVGALRELLELKLEMRDKVLDHEKRIAAVEKKVGIAS